MPDPTTPLPADALAPAVVATVPPPTNKTTVAADQVIAGESFVLADKPSSGVTIRRYKYGYSMEVKHEDLSCARFEIFVWNGSAFTACTTIQAGADGVFFEVRKPGDDGCLNFVVPRNGPMVIRTLRQDGKHVDLDLAPSGKLMVKGVEIEDFVRKLIKDQCGK